MALPTVSPGCINVDLVTLSQWSLRGTSEAMTISYDIRIRQIKINTKDRAVCVQAIKVYEEAEVQVHTVLSSAPNGDEL
jgi:hypothetical protein